MCFNQQEGSGLTTPVVGHERSVLSTKVLLPSTLCRLRSWFTGNTKHKENVQYAHLPFYNHL